MASAVSYKKERPRRSIRSSLQNTTNEHKDPPNQSSLPRLRDSSNHDNILPFPKSDTDKHLKLPVTPYKRTSYLPKPPTCLEKRRSWRRSVYKSLDHFAPQDGSELPDDLSSSSSSLTLATCSLTDASSQHSIPSITREVGFSSNRKNISVQPYTPPTYCLRIRKKRNNKAPMRNAVSPMTPDITMSSPSSKEEAGGKSRLSSSKGMAKIPLINDEESSKSIEPCDRSHQSPIKRRSILKKKNPEDLSSSMHSISSSNHSARFAMESVTIKEVPRLETEGGDLSDLFYEEDEIAQFRYDAWVEVMGLDFFE